MKDDRDGKRGRKNPPARSGSTIRGMPAVDGDEGSGELSLDIETDPERKGSEPALSITGTNPNRAFDFIAGFDSGYGAKPEPGMQLGFCAATGLRPEQVMMIGDSHHDLISGRAAGMVTVGVLTGLATADDLAPLADVVLNHIGELPAYLGHV